MKQMRELMIVRSDCRHTPLPGLPSKHRHLEEV